MNLAFVVNDPWEIEASSTTLALIRSAHARGHRIFIFGVADAGMDDDGRLFAHGFSYAPEGPEPPVKPFGLPPTREFLDELDVLAVRTSPGRDAVRWTAHSALMRWAQLLQSTGVWVFNPPRALLAGGTKDFLAQLPPETRPRMLISRSLREILDFVRENPDGSVIKPLVGTRGHDVYRLSPSQLDNARMIIENITRIDHVLAQAYVTDAPAGDMRVVLVDGDPLVVDGRMAAVRRVPQRGEFRSNVHLGGSAEPGEPNEAQLRTLAAIGPVLRANDLFLVGADLVGSQVIELNVYATGGLTDAGTFMDRDFVAEVISRLEARARSRSRAGSSRRPSRR